MKKVFYIIALFFYVVTSEIMAAPVEFEFDTIQTLSTVAKRAEEVRDSQSIEPENILVVISVDNVTSNDKGRSFLEGDVTAEVHQRLLRKGFKVVMNTSRCQLTLAPWLNFPEMAHRFQAPSHNNTNPLSVSKQFDLTGQFPGLNRSLDILVDGFEGQWVDGVLFGGPGKVTALANLLPKMGEIRHIIAVDHQDFFLRQYFSHPTIKDIGVTLLKYQ